MEELFRRCVQPLSPEPLAINERNMRPDPSASFHSLAVEPQECQRQAGYGATCVIGNQRQH